MSLFRVRVTRSRSITYEVEVEASTPMAAEDAARCVPVPTIEEKSDVDTDALCQVGEPWVYGWSGHDRDNAYFGRPDEYMDSTDLLVFKTAFGQVFSESDVALLVDRAARVVGPVSTHWNGAGTRTLSIKIKPPFHRLTDEQVASLMGPR